MSALVHLRTRNTTKGQQEGIQFIILNICPKGPLPGIPSIPLARVPCLRPPAECTKGRIFKVISFGPLCVELVLKCGPVTDEDVETIHVR